MRFAFSVSRMVQTFTALACLAITNFCDAEDWTVKDKVYHNVTVVEVRPYAVFVTYDGTTGRPGFPIADLSPELQKRFTYDPVKAKEAINIDGPRLSQLKSAERNMFSQSGSTGRWEEIQRERPGAVVEIEKHPLKFVGTLLYGDYSLHAAIADANASTVLVGKGGRCCLLSKRFFKEGEKVTLTVYQTKDVSVDGKTYACFSDDAGFAYDAAR